MQGDLRLEPATPALDAEPVHEVVADFPGAAAERLHLGKIGLLLEFENRAVKHHRGTGAGRNHHRIVACEGLYRVADDLAGRGPVAAVECGLAAAGLLLGKRDFHASVLEHLDGGGSHIIIEGIAQARGHKLDPLAGNGSALCVQHEGKNARPHRASLQSKTRRAGFTAAGRRRRRNGPALLRFSG
jgi:hypothetical protein